MHITHTTNKTPQWISGLAYASEKLLSPLVEYVRRARDRRKILAMLDLSAHTLRDVGLTRGDVIDASAARLGNGPSEILMKRRAERLERNGRILPLNPKRSPGDNRKATGNQLPLALTGKCWPN